MFIPRRVLLAAPALALPARAQDGRPIRFIVPYPPGGPTDLVGRIAAASMAPQPVVVENRAGGGGSIGAGEVTRAPPDGSVLMVNASAHVILPHLQPGLPYDAVTDFTPISELVKVPLIVVVPAASPIRDIAGLIAAARGGRLSYASSSIGGAPHLAGELFKLMAGVEMTHIPYRGSGPALQDLLGNTVQVMFDSLASSAGHVRSGALRAIAVTTAARLPAYPDVPTVAEAGVPGYEITTWYGLWGPPRLPAAIATRMRDAVAQGLATPEATTRLAALGAVQVASTPEEFTRFVASESARWGKLVRDAGIRGE
jgi:tripartite-type tricarboxylate transporter receptor subunit TctC